MSKQSREAEQRARQSQQAKLAPDAKIVDSLLNNMKDGREYASIVDLIPNKLGFDLIDEAVAGIQAIETIRGRPCLMYVGNVIAKDGSAAGVDASDDLPFQELVASVLNCV